MNRHGETVIVDQVIVEDQDGEKNVVDDNGVTLLTTWNVLYRGKRRDVPVDQ